MAVYVSRAMDSMKRYRQYMFAADKATMDGEVTKEDR